MWPPFYGQVDYALIYTEGDATSAFDTDANCNTPLKSPYLPLMDDSAYKDKVGNMIIMKINQGSFHGRNYATYTKMGLLQYYLRSALPISLSITAKTIENFDISVNYGKAVTYTNKVVEYCPFKISICVVKKKKYAMHTSTETFQLGLGWNSVTMLNLNYDRKYTFTISSPIILQQAPFIPFEIRANFTCQRKLQFSQYTQVSQINIDMSTPVRTTWWS